MNFINLSRRLVFIKQARASDGVELSQFLVVVRLPDLLDDVMQLVLAERVHKSASCLVLLGASSIGALFRRFNGCYLSDK